MSSVVLSWVLVDVLSQMGEGLLLLDGLLGTEDPAAEPASPLSALCGVRRPQVNKFTTDRSILGRYLGPQFMVLSVVPVTGLST